MGFKKKKRKGRKEGRKKKEGNPDLIEAFSKSEKAIRGNENCLAIFEFVLR